MRMIIVPDVWPCKLVDCPPGFFVYDGELCFKTEYRNESGDIEVYCESGECFWGGVQTTSERDELEVQPVQPKWEEE